MVKIRLRRVGAKKQPSYRLVVADSRSPRDGRFIESIGHYNPRTDPPTVVIREDRALYWLSVGAQPSEAVGRFFTHLGLSDKLEKVQSGQSIEDVAQALVQVSGPKEEIKPTPAAPKPEEKQPAEAESMAEEAPEAKAEKAPDAKAKAEAAPAAKAEKAPDAKAKAEAAPEAKAEKAPEAKAKAEAAPAAKAEKAPDAEAKAEAAPEAKAEKAKEPEKAPAKAAEAPAKKAEGKARPLAELGLSTRWEHVLVGAGVKTVADLKKIADKGDDALREISGIGDKAVEEIHEKLNAEG
jgi:small subunit ribosomal protein S16